ncbi:MAG: choice-of-anchor D domain-containing protein [Terriglobia bacterium]
MHRQFQIQSRGESPRGGHRPELLFSIYIGIAIFCIFCLPQNAAGQGMGGHPAPSVSLSPSSLSFGSQSVGATSTAQTITLTNTGNASLTITRISVKGTNAGNFAQTNTCSGSVAAYHTCTIKVTFTPTAILNRTASISITDNAVGSPQTVSLSGTGTSSAPVVSLSSTSLAFGNQPVRMTSAVQTVTLTNTGKMALSITSFAVTGANANDFAEANICGSSVAAGAKCTIAVMFTPSAAGARTAALSMSDNANGSPQTVPLSGTGSHDVFLSWTASVTLGVMGYNVYRGTTSGGESSTPLNSMPINGTTFTDENVTARATYYYVVTAVASDDVTQSANSNEAAATVPSS